VAGRLLSLIAQRPRLIVSLPANAPDLARAAADGGAEALKVHLRVKHLASGTEFGDLAAERPRLEQILALGLPVGLVPGTSHSLPDRAEMEELAAMGMDFFDLFARDMPAWMLAFEGMTRVAAVDGSADAQMVRSLENIGVEMIEAAIVAPEGYGQPLRAADLAAYCRLRCGTSLPIIVPTERAITPEDVPLLVGRAGISAVMIGAVVTGREPRSLRAAAERFASALAETHR